MKKTMIDRITDHLYPVGGGIIAAMTNTIDILSQITIADCVETAILAAIGATVGYIIKLSIDKITKKDES